MALIYHLDKVSKTFAHFLFELFAFLPLGLEFSSYTLDGNLLRHVSGKYFVLVCGLHLNAPHRDINRAGGFFLFQ